jgi:tetratricopeptide (TPR) repeat protein
LVLSRRSKLLILAAIALIAQFAIVSLPAIAGQGDDKVCDPLADYYLGMEDYPAAIRRHDVVIREHPDSALAHYHLGFAYGVLGDHQRELTEYRKAVELGLSDWELFLNLGLVYMETGRSADALAVLRLSALLGSLRPETHFNLGLAYERLSMLRQAEQELLLSLRLDPDQMNARNMLGVVYAEEGNYARAYQEWSDLAASNPEFAPARANLSILQRVERRDINGPLHVSGFASAP